MAEEIKKETAPKETAKKKESTTTAKKTTTTKAASAKKAQAPKAATEKKTSSTKAEPAVKAASAKKAEPAKKATAAKKETIKPAASTKKATLTKSAEKKPQKPVIVIRLKGYEHTVVDNAAAKVVDLIKRNSCEFSGPIPLPTKKEVVTILRAVHKYKDSREQFEQRTHKRMIQVKEPSDKLVKELMNIELPAGVDIEVKQ